MIRATSVILLLASLALSIPGHRVLMLGTMRPEVPETWTASVTRLDNAAILDTLRVEAGGQ